MEEMFYTCGYYSELKWMNLVQVPPLWPCSSPLFPLPIFNKHTQLQRLCMTLPFLLPKVVFLLLFTKSLLSQTLKSLHLNFCVKSQNHSPSTQMLFSSYPILSLQDSPKFSISSFCVLEFKLEFKHPRVGVLICSVSWIHVELKRVPGT